MFKSGDRQSRIDARADKNVPKALAALYRRRAWVIGQLARDRLGMTGGAMNAEVDHHAQALFFIDHAIESLSTETEQDPGA